MTETIESTSPTKSSGGLSSKLLPELKTIAAGMGIKTSGLKKADLVSAIRAAQGGGKGATQSADQGANKGSDKSADQGAKRRAPKREAAQDQPAPARE
ncbi:MAG TPA: Rho termination factor N-terminal domain-containing protein, partial [Marmoricola sp.]|nr:Rho termination factor N-terminal domain-containing protein [Marmoricola sp.]